ncbi:MAG: PQQ-dependent sugar dehydrogenase, partial [Kiritimatiellia bacterium]
MNIPTLAGILLAITTTTAPAQSPDPKMKVEQIFQTYCSSCHGDKFQGGQGGVLVDGVWNHGSTDAEITRSIAKGNLQLGMNPWEETLSPEQIRAMVVFLREKEKEFAGRKIEYPKPEPGRITKTELLDYKIELVADQLEIPWAVAFLPKGEILLTERPGRLRVIDADGKRRDKPVSGTPEVIHHGQGGLMDVAVHPDYAKNGWIYLALADGWREGNDPR